MSQANPSLPKDIFALACVGFVVALPLAIGAACLHSVGTAPSLGRIAFDSLRDGNWEIYVMNADGSDQTRLTHNPSVDEHPAWSRDGHALVFQSLREGNFELYTLELRDGREKRITSTLGDEQNANWSSQDKGLIFESLQGHVSLGVEVLDFTTGERSTILPAGSYGPVFSADDRHLCYYLSPGEQPSSQIFRRDVNGVNEVQLTFTKAGQHNSNPTWSPDGKRIAFQSLRDGNWEIYVMNFDGSKLTRLTFNRFSDGYPTWSLDGQQIAFESDRGGVWQIYVMKADGSQQARVTDDPRGARHPRWSPKP